MAASRGGPGEGGSGLAEILLMALAIAFWSAEVALAQPIWSNIDEGDHWSYATLVAELKLPAAETGGEPASAVAPWGRTSLESFQPPVAYLLLAAVKAALGLAYPALEAVAGRLPPLPVLSVYVLRLVNSLVFAIITVLLFLAGRSIAPGRPLFAVAAAACSFVWRGWVLDLTRVGNDVIAAALVALAIYLSVRWRQRLTAARAVLLGLVGGLAIDSKYLGAYALVPVCLIILVTPVGRRARVRSLAHVAIVAAIAGIALLPWLLLQRAVHGYALGTEKMRELLPPGVMLPPLRWSSIGDWGGQNLFTAINGQYWASVTARPSSVGAALFVAVGALAALGVLAAVTPDTAGPPRPISVVMLVSTPAAPAFLLALSITSHQNLVETGRYDIIAWLPVCFLLALAPARFVPDRWSAPAARAFVLLALALATTEAIAVQRSWAPAGGIAVATPELVLGCLTLAAAALLGSSIWARRPAGRPLAARAGGDSTPP